MLNHTLPIGFAFIAKSYLKKYFCINGCFLAKISSNVATLVKKKIKHLCHWQHIDFWHHSSELVCRWPELDPGVAFPVNHKIRPIQTTRYESSESRYILCIHE